MKQRFQTYLKALMLGTCLWAAQPASAATVMVSSSISGNTTWYSTNEYILTGFIYVLNGGVLNIEAGTVIKGQPGTDAATKCLIVTVGGKIFANGTRSKPIIFTAEADDVTDPDDLPIFQRGLWGGVVLMGRSVLNTCSDTTGNAASPKYDIFEGLPDAQVSGQFVHRFGGNDDNDSSGVMRYVSIRHGGVVFQPNKELNALTLCGVGRGTTIEYVEMYAAADDGVEFFGGTVNTKHLVSAFNDDDCFDIDQGYRGKNQFWFAIQERGKKDNGGEWNGEPNAISVNAAPIANYEIYNGTWIGAGTNTTANRAIIAREYAAPKLYNSILTEFGGNALSIDVKAAIHLTNGLLDIRDNIWWNFATNGVPVALAENAQAQIIFSDAARSNLNINPLLRGISRANNGALDPRPLPGSPALTSPRTAPDDGFYDPIAYKGAFDGNDLWICGWTFLSQKGFIPARGANIVNVSANISGNVTWYRTNQYILTGFIYVLNGGVLNIEAGTVIKGQPGTDAATKCLIVTVGGKIFANGTAANPIIFTAEADDVDDNADLPIFQRGLWGGVVLMGKSALNTCSDTTGNAASPKYDIFEGLPDTQVSGQFVHRFGGNDDNDSSGVMRYVSIRHGGVVFQPNKELNALTLCGVGRGTTLEYIEMYAAADDGVEFFGGTVNTKHLVSAFNDDDCFDIDQGYRGKNQFWFGIQERGKKDNGGEWNGEPNAISVNAAPIANYEIYNGTWIGAGTNTTANRAIIAREYAAPKLYNSILTEFGGNALSIDVKAAIHLTNGLLDIRDNIWWNFATNGVPVALAENAQAQIIFSDAARSNLNINPLLRGISRANTPAFQLDPRPQTNSPALTSPRTPPSNGFYDQVAYKGAFKDVNWASDWTFLGEACFITSAGAGVPKTPAAPACIATTLAIVSNGANVDIAFASVSGSGYRLISSNDIAAPRSSWSTVSTLTATGSTSTFSVAAAGLQRFFVVVCQ